MAPDVGETLVPEPEGRDQAQVVPGGAILLVCTANVTRSPAAEHLLRQRLSGTPALGVRIHSAGTHAAVGESLDPRMEQVLRARGLSAISHSSAPVQGADLAAATLVLTMGAEHRSHVAGLAPDTRTKTFTLLEFSRLAPLILRQGLSGVGLVTAVEEASRLRSSGTSVPRSLSIDDPRGRSRWAYRRTVRLLADALDPIAALVGVVGSEP